jgi:hypothetical protein
VRDQRTRQGGGDAEHGHALLLDQPPHAVGREVGGAFREDERGTDGVAADHGPRAHDPAHVGHEVDDVVGASVGLVGDLARDRDEEAALDVQHALRCPGRPGRIGQEIGRLGVELGRRQLTRPACDELVPGRDDDMLERRRLAPGLLEDLEHRHLATAPQRRPRGDRDLGFGCLQSLRDGRRGEAGEDRHLNCADVRAGVRGDRDLGSHRQKERDTISLRDAELDERLRQARHLVRQCAERQRAPGAVFAETDGRDRVRPRSRPAVHAVPGDVDLAADEPGRPLGPAREVDDLVPGPEELEAEVLDHGGPEPLGLLLRAAHELPVVVEPVPAHEAHDVGPLEGGLVGLPDERGGCPCHACSSVSAR